jgi:hypothetical protein
MPLTGAGHEDAPPPALTGATTVQALVGLLLVMAIELVDTRLVDVTGVDVVVVDVADPPVDVEVDSAPLPLVMLDELSPSPSSAPSSPPASDGLPPPSPPPIGIPIVASRRAGASSPASGVVAPPSEPPPTPTLASWSSAAPVAQAITRTPTTKNAAVGPYPWRLMSALSEASSRTPNEERVKPGPAFSPAPARARSRPGG